MPKTQKHHLSTSWHGHMPNSDALDTIQESNPQNPLQQKSYKEIAKEEAHAILNKNKI